MAPKKSKAVRRAEKSADFIPMHNNARDIIRRHLGVPTIGELKQADLATLRNKVEPGKPALFLTEFDGTTFFFAVSVAGTTKLIDKVDITRLPDAAEATARIQLKKWGLI